MIRFCLRGVFLSISKSFYSVKDYNNLTPADFLTDLFQTNGNIVCAILLIQLRFHHGTVCLSI